MSAHDWFLVSAGFIALFIFRKPNTEFMNTKQKWIPASTPPKEGCVDVIVTGKNCTANQGTYVGGDTADNAGLKPGFYFFLGDGSFVPLNRAEWWIYMPEKP